LPDLRLVDGAGRASTSIISCPRTKAPAKDALGPRICHHKLHSLFAERELARLYATPVAVRARPEMQCFIR
jgi:hypothetical protein